MIPEKNKQEWKDLISGKIDYAISSFSLQMKINSLKLIYKHGKTTLEDAANDLYQTCLKYERIYEDDLKKIFKLK